MLKMKNKVGINTLSFQTYYNNQDNVILVGTEISGIEKKVYKLTVN